MLTISVIVTCMALNGADRGGAMSCQSQISFSSSTLLGLMVLTLIPGTASKAALSCGGACMAAECARVNL